jgi:hypothetical protein
MVDTPLLARHLRGEIENALDSARVVNVIGPWQVGKTTLVRDLLGGGGRYVSLDDTGVLAAIEGDPYGQLLALADEAGDGPVIIDEAQRSRGVALAIKRIVDERRRMGQFLLTGSSNVFTATHVADSLAGRVQTLMLPPLSAAEIHHAGPPLLLDWAARTANELTIEDLCSGVGVQRQTLEAYLDALTRLSVVTQLGAWASGAAKREIKRPKIHLLDTGVTAALRGFTPTSFAPDNDPMALGGGSWKPTCTTKWSKACPIRPMSGGSTTGATRMVARWTSWRKAAVPWWPWKSRRLPHLMAMILPICVGSRPRGQGRHGRWSDWSSISEIRSFPSAMTFMACRCRCCGGGERRSGEEGCGVRVAGNARAGNTIQPGNQASTLARPLVPSRQSRMIFFWVAVFSVRFPSATVLPATSANMALITALSRSNSKKVSSGCQWRACRPAPEPACGVPRRQPDRGCRQGWLNRCRRLAKDWENLNHSAPAFLRLASIRLMLRKLCNHS